MAARRHGSHEGHGYGLKRPFPCTNLFLCFILSLSYIKGSGGEGRIILV
jgi:hypothetical protein